MTKKTRKNYVTLEKLFNEIDTDLTYIDLGDPNTYKIQIGVTYNVVDKNIIVSLGNKDYDIITRCDNDKYKTTLKRASQFSKLVGYDDVDAINKLVAFVGSGVMESFGMKDNIFATKCTKVTEALYTQRFFA